MSKKDEQKELKKKVKEAMKIYNKKEDEKSFMTDLNALGIGGVVFLFALVIILFAN